MGLAKRYERWIGNIVDRLNFVRFKNIDFLLMACMVGCVIWLIDEHIFFWMHDLAGMITKKDLARFNYVADVWLLGSLAYIVGSQHWRVREWIRKRLE